MKKVMHYATTVLFILILAGFGAALFLKVPSLLSISERRELEQIPKVTAKSILDGTFMTDFEDALLDQFPLRDSFRRMKALFLFGIFREKDSHGIYISDGEAVAVQYPMNKAAVARNSQKIKKILDTYCSEMNVYVSFIPDKAYFLSEKKGFPAIDYDEMQAILMSKVTDAKYIDITETLDIGCYYKTDSHWSQDKLIPAANKLLRTMTGGDLSGVSFTEHALYPFYGVYYGQSALPLSPDSLVFLTSDTLDSAIVKHFYASGKDLADGTLYDPLKIESNDPYNVFLGGLNSIITIENPKVKNGRQLYLFRDSFGSCLAPLLLEQYEQITLIDLRYMGYDSLAKYIDFAPGSDVLFIYSTVTVDNGAILKVDL
jgi:hypothetical protein